MHAPGYRWTIFLVGITVLLTLGCRGSKPFGRFVQVTQEPESELPPVDPPRQRLATSKPRSDAEVAVTSHDESSPHVERLVTNRTASTPQSMTAEKDLIASKLPNRSSEEARGSTSRRVASRPEVTSQPSSTTNSADRIAAAQPARTSNPKPAPSDSADLMAAFSDYPPEVQREALRRLVAATARSAEQTAQPRSLDAALTNNLDRLPALPPADETNTESSPTRLASSAQRESTRRSAAKPQSPAARPVVALIEDSANPKKLINHDKIPELMIAESEELEPIVVQTTSDTSAGDGTSVQTASASRDANDDDKVARAAIETPTAKVKSTRVAGMLEPESSVLDEDSLYATLVKRLSKAPAGESESERASRMIKLRHLMVLSGDLDSAVEQIEGMPESEQEFLRHQLLGLWTMVDPDGHPVASRRITSALPQLREAAKFAAAATDSLEVRSLSFCTEIESYGQIKPFKGNRFDGGQQVILYCEIENFSVNKNADGYETHLQGSYDIYNAKNEKVVSQLLPADKQVSANYLRDYFIAYQMHLPAQLAAGTYRLQLTMEDVNGKKYGQSSIPFEIAK